MGELLTSLEWSVDWLGLVGVSSSLVWSDLGFLRRTGVDIIRSSFCWECSTTSAIKRRASGGFIEEEDKKRLIHLQSFFEEGSSPSSLFQSHLFVDDFRFAFASPTCSAY